MRQFIFFLSAFVCLQTANAEQSNFRQEESHVHGVATLNVVLEKQQLFMELESPAANIVGFEHKPNNQEQEQSIQDAKALLAKATEVFTLPGEADCQIAKTEVEWSMEEEEHHDEHDKEHAEEEHHDEHDKEHTEEEHHDEHEEETHSEFHVMYEFQCNDPAQLKFVDVLLFKHFTSMEEIEAQVIGPGGQTAVELTADANRINL